MLPVQVTGVRKSEYDRLMVTTALLLIACPGSGSKFYDLLLVSKKQSALDGAKSCRSYGYDGLASVHSPEAFTYAKKISYDQWKNDGGIFIGLTLLPGGQPMWEDGTLPASDTPCGRNDPPAQTDQALYARIPRVGKVRFCQGHQLRACLCGRYNDNEITEV